MSRGNYIESDVLPAEFFQKPKLSNYSDTFSLSENEKETIINALSKAKNNKSEAAKLLNITRKTLYNKLKNYNID